jgi:hypothetical protein
LRQFADARPTGHAEVFKLLDERIKLQVFGMRSMASGGAFHCAYLDATQQAFLEAHELAFSYVGGVFRNQPTPNPVERLQVLLLHRLFRTKRISGRPTASQIAAASPHRTWKTCFTLSSPIVFNAIRYPSSPSEPDYVSAGRVHTIRSM